MKVFVRTLYKTRKAPLWNTEDQREQLRLRLNKLGFYVLTGLQDNLYVHAIYDEKPIESIIFNEIFDKIGNFWYTRK